MPMNRSGAAIKRKIEEGQQELLAQKIPAAQLSGQIVPQNLGPRGNTGQGYTPDPDAVTRVSVRKNSAGSVFSRRRLNFIEGTGATITVADDSGSEEVDITIAASGGGGGGATVNTGADASKGTGTSGDLYLPNDGFYAYRSTGAAQVPWGPIFPMTAPVSGDFAWINQGGATVDTTSGGIFLQTDGSGSTNLRIRKKAAPSTPYTITIAFIPHLIVANGSQNVGLVFRQASDGKLHTFTLAQSNGDDLHMWEAKYTDASTFSAHYAGFPYAATAMLAGNVVFYRIADNGTNRISSYSRDGQHWQVIHTIGRTDYLTADEVGFYVSDNAGTQSTGMTLLSWKEA